MACEDAFFPILSFSGVFHSIFNNAIFSLFAMHREQILSVALEKREVGKSFRSKGKHDC